MAFPFLILYKMCYLPMSKYLGLCISFTSSQGFLPYSFFCLHVFITCLRRLQFPNLPTHVEFNYTVDFSVVSMPCVHSRNRKPTGIGVIYSQSEKNLKVILDPLVTKYCVYFDYLRILKNIALRFVGLSKDQCT